MSRGEKPQLMKESDWEEAISRNAEVLHQLNGHFAVVQWDGDHLECTTDQLGMRNIFLHEGDVSYPYWMKDLTSAVWMRIKQKLEMQYHSTRQADFFFEIEEYVRDLAESQSTRECPAYNRQKVQQLVSGFYDEKNINLAGELNWWLAFEVFRRVGES